ncbi:MAG: thioredoxin domain-containing protein [Planctomycetes bacterium]|nr:thioredoxin domain-containing protein [Planctomycetota bacterium]
MKSYSLLLGFLLIIISSCSDDGKGARKHEPAESGSAKKDDPASIGTDKKEIKETKKMNRLGKEVSPYLLQHADNPVDWYPWEKEAFEKAKTENKPIFLSIGYSTCHWCHVMEHESFENEEIAEILNKNFISIKVDREEKPDIDDIYMKAVVEMNQGRGGWPLSIFITHEGKPFFGGTYFQPHHFKTLLMKIAETWAGSKNEIIVSAEEITQAMKGALSQNTSTDAKLGKETITEAAEHLKNFFDSEYGGFSRAPKFPAPTTLEFLLIHYYLSNDKQILSMLTKTADFMALGGIYDQVGGGFHRYSTDEKWLVPHFEKMLYDNAQLISFYANLFKVTGDQFYKRISTETAEYLIREMKASDGGYFAAQDADSEGIEGKYYCWDKTEIERLLSDEQKKLFAKYIEITNEPNFVIDHGDVTFASNVLALKTQINSSDTEAFNKIKELLFKTREKRIKPHTDTKILTSWNSQLIEAFCSLYKISGNSRYLDEAAGICNFIYGKMFKDGNLYHSYARDTVRTTGLLEDSSYLCRALLTLYEATFNENYILKAELLAGQMKQIFYDSKNGGFFDYDPSTAEYIYTMKDPHDGVAPSPNATAIEVIQKLYTITYNEEYGKLAKDSLNSFSLYLNRFPAAYTSLTKCLAHEELGLSQIVIAMPDSGKSEFINSLNSIYLPLSQIFIYSKGSKLSVVKDKTAVESRETAYVCTAKTCTPPITDITKLKEILSATKY